MERCVPDGRRRFLLLLQEEEDNWLARRPKNNMKESLDDMKYQVFSQLIDVENNIRKEFNKTLNILYNHVTYTVEKIKNDVQREYQKHSATKKETTLKVVPELIFSVPSFHGKTSIDVYLRKFNLIAEINKWTDSEKVINLIAAMHGSATKALTSLMEKPLDYIHLQTQIRTYFTRNTDYINSFENILVLEQLGQSKNGESVEKLTQSVNIIENVLPTASAALIDYLQVHYFIRGISNIPLLQRRLVEQHHLCLDSVLNTAGIREIEEQS